jgi:hypothetical protein
MGPSSELFSKNAKGQLIHELLLIVGDCIVMAPSQIGDGGMSVDSLGVPALLMAGL